MILIVCLDDKNGYSFASRRQSRDKIQLERMMKTVGESKLFMTDYSAKLFETLPNNVIVCQNPQASACKGDFCFIENLDITAESEDIERLIIYRWNRSYPSDKKLPTKLLADMRLVSAVDFKGNSHEKLTEEVYDL